jgi:hypothetical protein
MSWDELAALVSRLQQAFRAHGVGEGDRIAAMMPNMPETVACMLAAASIGAIWSSCSPDFGVQGVLDRFGQIEPKLFISCDGYWYNGKRQEVADKLTEPSRRAQAQATVIVPMLDDARPSPAPWKGAKTLADFIADFPAKPSPSSRCRSRIRSTSCFPPAPPAFPNASCIRPAAPCCSISRSTACIAASRARRAAVLLHHLRLDDVELAGLRPGRRRHAVPV